MTRLTGGELVGLTLKQAGVSNVYTLYGGHLDPICASVRRLGIAYIDTLHEVAAGYAAEGFARASGSFGVALVSAAPGYTNVLTSMTNAYIDRTPVVYILGSAALADAETNNFMSGFDSVDVAKPITKWAHCVTRVEDIPRLLAHAIRVATTGAPGPVLLDIPMDVLFATVEREKVAIPANIVRRETPVPHPDLITDALHLLASAKRPIIMAGEGASRSRVEDELLKFAECAGIPVFTDYQGYGLIPGDHPLFAGGFLKLAEFIDSDQRPDAVLALGVRFGFLTAGPTRLVPAQAKVIHVDLDPVELGRTRPVEVPITADCRETLKAINAASPGMQWPDWRSWQQTLLKAREARKPRLDRSVEGRGDNPIPPYRAAREIVKALGDDTLVIVDGADTHQWIAEVLVKNRPHEFFSHGSHFGCLGYGLGFSMGVSNARPGQRVALISGDGAFGFTIAELHTLARHELPVICIVMNNKAWGATSHFQDVTFGPDAYFGVDLAGAQYHTIAEGFGCLGIYVTRAEDIAPAIAKAQASNRPCCINIEVEKRDIPPDNLALQFLHQ